ncbi:OmpH family outer membrane protein [Deinococcus radiopugnans]|uniref:Outer membrane protein n=1 Tax=Deinococcus radiopugnans ATCC 19172 TaxID=585398 RepID=A0A5C4Y7Y1_9DEIO|nr:OmpH family outer membrane protein [Deinococcus radiopugnans]MBB6016518.1 outer membrane protein [Deinococcus radiopugnans ATCC 19172]QLG10423.1 OmpH family outer membrane protein [Deinococcus sp. D7000]TNM71147.1 OmpH family outer membrane protein [Deinococcus radiopugnans ATCC 19172]
MNKFLILLPLALLATVPHAQGAKNRLGLVDVQAAVKALPASKAYLDLSARVDADLKARRGKIDELAGKAASSGSAADRKALLDAQQAYNSTQTAYRGRIATAFEPVAAKLNAAVAKVAKANGYSVVMDQRVAAQNRLVIYANASATDLTAAVIKALK